MTRRELEQYDLERLIEALPTDIYNGAYGLRIKPRVKRNGKREWGVRYIGKINNAEDVRRGFTYTIKYRVYQRRLKFAVIKMLLVLQKDGVVINAEYL